ncbi:hypothetical protein JKP88DRAFT_243894 [Tribonema minus]|uniref:Smr domain-containing protein n=1 Tax=Tribonema minus TaxID=303371 RepID=A0A835Z604_9STRA|nr:hypothetical protein JKP88DRAFT_243894 [Tribonema minus]
MLIEKLQELQIERDLCTVWTYGFDAMSRKRAQLCFAVKYFEHRRGTPKLPNRLISKAAERICLLENRTFHMSETYLDLLQDVSAEAEYVQSLFNRLTSERSELSKRRHGAGRIKAIDAEVQALLIQQFHTQVDQQFSNDIVIDIQSAYEDEIELIDLEDEDDEKHAILEPAFTTDRIRFTNCVHIMMLEVVKDFDEPEDLIHIALQITEMEEMYFDSAPDRRSYENLDNMDAFIRDVSRAQMDAIMEQADEALEKLTRNEYADDNIVSLRGIDETLAWHKLRVQKLQAEEKALETKIRELVDEKTKIQDQMAKKTFKPKKKGKSKKSPPPPPPKETIARTAPETVMNDVCGACLKPWCDIKCSVAEMPCRHATCLQCVAGQQNASIRTTHPDDEEDIAQRFACPLCRRKYPNGIIKRAVDWVLQDNEHLLQLASAACNGSSNSGEFLHSALLANNLCAAKTANYLLDIIRYNKNPDGLEQIYERARAPVQAIETKLEELRSAKPTLAVKKETNDLAIRRQAAVYNAALDIFESVNRQVNNPTLVDLHGLHADEAVTILQEFVLPVVGVAGDIVIITGRGTRNRRGESVLRNTVTKFLQEQGVAFKFKPGNDGAVCVYK